jgi:hypothetical protein
MQLGLEVPNLIGSVDPISESGSRYSKTKCSLKENKRKFHVLNRFDDPSRVVEFFLEL